MSPWFTASSCSYGYLPFRETRLHQSHAGPASLTPARSFLQSFKSRAKDLSGCIAEARTGMDGMKELEGLVAAQDWGEIVKREASLRKTAEAAEPGKSAFILSCLGYCFWRLCQFDKALDLHERAGKLAAEAGNRAFVGTSHSNQGCCHVSMGQYDKALAHLQKGMEIAQELGDLAEVQKARNDLAFCYTWLGQYVRAAQIRESVKGTAKAVEELSIIDRPDTPRSIAETPPRLVPEEPCGNSLFVSAERGMARPW